MKALHFLKLMGLCLALLSLSTCKKYPEGGFVKQTCKHLFGSNKIGSNKTWKLKKYEVNGIDSTYLIQGANSIPDFYEKFVTFKYSIFEVSPKFEATTFLWKFKGTVDDLEKKLNIGLFQNPTKEDSIQCKIIDNINYCNRNILAPELNSVGKKWYIKKLTRTELVIETNWNLKNNYKITLTC
jgi:hypothetical protein